MGKIKVNEKIPFQRIEPGWFLLRPWVSGVMIGTFIISVDFDRENLHVNVSALVSGEIEEAEYTVFDIIPEGWHIFTSTGERLQ